MKTSVSVGVAILVLVLACGHLTHARRATVTKPCQYDVDCTENSFCKGNTECQCKDAYFIYRDADDNYNERCLPKVTSFGDVCAAHDQCRLAFDSDSICLAGACSCRQGARFVADRNRCFNTSNVGGHCLTSENCYIGPDYPLVCERSICTCLRLQHPSANGTVCLPSKFLGEQCSKQDECVTFDSLCDNVCRCSESHIANRNKSKCLKGAVKVGDACEEQDQCSLLVKDSTCRERKCVCIEGFHPGHTQTGCWKNVWPGEPCVNNNQCMSSLNDTELAVCEKDVCQCLPGLRPEGRICIPTGGSSSIQVGLFLVTAAAVAAVISKL